MDTSPLAQFHDDFQGVLAAIIQSFMTSMKQHGLSTPQIHALMYIFHAGACQVSDLGLLADVSNAAASQLAERLVKQGLVERREDPTNRRNKLLTLSEKGKGLINQSILSNPFFMEVIQTLTPEERLAVHEAFTLLARAGRQVQGIHDVKGMSHASHS